MLEETFQETKLTSVLIAVLVIFLLSWLKKEKQSGSLPPGPPTNVWGSTDIPGKHSWRTLKEFADNYGDLITIRSTNKKNLFVCSSATVADAILQKKSSVTTDRPHLIMAGDLISGNKRILVIGQGERWRLYRRIMHETLNNSRASTYEPIQRKEATLTLLAIGEAPDTFQRQFSRYAASVIMTLTYDLPVKSLDEPRILQVAECLNALGKWMNPRASPLDSWPFLNLIPTPVNPYKKLGKRLHQRELSLFLSTYTDVRKRVKDGTAQTCFASQLQEKQTEYGLTDEEACYIAGSLFGAGSDTTASALSIFVLAMISHPEVVSKAQEEIDRIIGTERLPTFEDQKDLKYVSALCQEISRWRPVSSGGFQHALTEDVQYKSFLLPKGSAIVGNHWAIHMDPNEYPEPEKFKPERFLNEDGELIGTWFSPKGHYQFGFGRRVCVGSNVAERSIYINVAMMLWTFTFDAPNNRPDLVDTLAFTSSANSHPLPFKATIRFRSKERKQLVEQEAATY